MKRAPAAGSIASKWPGYGLVFFDPKQTVTIWLMETGNVEVMEK